MSTPTPGEIETALWNAMTAAVDWSAKLPGVAFKPAAGSPWLRGTWMPNPPEKVAFGAGVYHRQSGVWQVDLWYPKSVRRVDLLLAAAKSMRDAYWPASGQGFAIDAGGGQLIVDKLPNVSGVDEAADEAFNRVMVEVVIRLEIPPAG